MNGQKMTRKDCTFPNFTQKAHLRRLLKTESVINSQVGLNTRHNGSFLPTNVIDYARN